MKFVTTVDPFPALYNYRRNDSSSIACALSFNDFDRYTQRFWTSHRRAAYLENLDSAKFSSQCKFCGHAASDTIRRRLCATNT